MKKTKNNYIDITFKQKELILSLLERFIPNTEVWVYGSRAKWTARPYSDLDMVAFVEDNQKNKVFQLKEAFEDSDLPFKVDFFIWDEIPQEFHENIKKEHVVLQKRKKEAIPKGWKKVKLKCLVKSNHNNINKKFPYQIIKYLDTSSITKGKIEDLQTINLSEAPSRAKRLLKDETIVYSTVRPLQCHYGFIKNPEPNMVISTGFSVIETNKSKAVPLFIYYFLTLNKTVSKLSSIAEGSTSAYPSILPSDIENLDILLPPLPKQKAIAEVLSSFDDKIELLHRQNKILEDMAQTIFKSWFIDFDPVHAKKLALDKGLSKKQAERAAMATISGVCSPKEFSLNFKEMNKRLTKKLSKMSKKKQEELAYTASLFPSEFEDSELGEIPKGWSTESLDKNINFLNGLALQKFPPKNDGTDLPVLKIAQLRKGIIEGADYASSNIQEKYVVKSGDLIFSWSASLMVKIWFGEKVALNQHLFKVTSDSYPSWLQWQWCKYYISKFQSIAKGKATTMGHIQRKHLKEAKIIIPKQKQLNQFNKIFEPILSKIINSNEEIKSLEKLKDTLLPKLLAGEIDLSSVKLDKELNEYEKLGRTS